VVRDNHPQRASEEPHLHKDYETDARLQGGLLGAAVDAAIGVVNTVLAPQAQQRKNK
jgi:hypothetical protein